MHHPRFLAAAVSLAALSSLVGCGAAPAPPLLLNDVVFAGDRFIAVGSKERLSGTSGDATATGAIITSADGITWKQVDIDVDLPLWSVAQGNGRIVAVGGSIQPNGTTRHGVVLVSDDGHAWERVDLEPDVALSSVVHGDGRFVALTFGPLELTSTDGHDWALAEQSGGLANGAHDTAFGNGVFVTSGGASAVAFSNDGVSWLATGFDSQFAVQSVSFAGGAFFAGLAPPYCPEDCGGPFPVARSTGGVGWSTVTDSLSHGLAGVAFQDGVFVGATYPALLRSTDGMTWSPASGAEDRTWTGVAAGPSGFVAVGKGFAAHSADGAAWAEVAVDVP